MNRRGAGPTAVFGVGPENAVILMSNDTPDKPDEDEDWMKYANAGFGETDYSLWDDQPAEQDEAEEEPDFDLNSTPNQLGTHMEEIPRAPSPAGHKHLVRIGTCDHCLGRLGGKKRYEQTIAESGAEIRASVVQRDSHLENARTEIPLCPFCENLYEEADLLADIIHDAIQPYEATRLQLGARIPKDQIAAEEELRKRLGAGGSDALKSGLVTEIARNLNDRLDGKKLVNDKPQILALIDVLTLTVELDIRAHYLYGRYQKLERGIPQTRWPCRACKGRGCEKCEGTGLQYKKSVQDLIGNPLLGLFEAKEHAFHGMGREDIDVRCLGQGRPFVIEMKEPKIRTVDLDAAMNSINELAEGSIKITGLRSSNRSEVVRVKDTPAEKSYTIRFRVMPLSEAEHAVLTAPVDLTHVDVQDRGGKGRKNPKRRNRRGDRKNDHKKPLPAVIEVVEGPSEEELKAFKKAELVEKAEALGLVKSGTKGDLIERIMSAGPPAPVMFDLPKADFIKETIDKLAGVKLFQRTPERVAHRRADLIRKRTVFETSKPIIETMPDGVLEVEFTLRCESGTYVKETVHGDGGRTQPSLSSLIKAKCDVMWLDVGDIHAD
ncbi:MAG: tRNA pseudouridine(54/55) synthase Pus10 [Candidatus Poseidoniaceae archaeon]|nr:tRNA pseudouridine(54/55) synthase Pus10 [Candidatus Poseidoniaceae archaeon]